MLKEVLPFVTCGFKVILDAYIQPEEERTESVQDKQEVFMG